MSVPAGPRRSTTQSQNLKILVVGNSGAGKSSLVHTYLGHKFQSNIKTTIGSDFFYKTVTGPDGNAFDVQLWDLSGQERFNTLTRAFFKGAQGAVVVFDVTTQLTFDQVDMWKQGLDEKVVLPDGRQLPVVLLANKTDLKRDLWIPVVREQEQMAEYCKEKGFVKCFETSAKNGKNVEAAFSYLVERILAVDEPTPVSGSRSLVDLKKDQEPAASNCC